MKHSDEICRLRRLFAVGHAALILITFAPLLFLMLAVGLNVDVVYFVGWPFSLLLVFVATALFLPLLHLCVRPTSTLFQLGFWVPALVLTASAVVYTMELAAARNAMASAECLASPAKSQLNLAYNSANEFFTICQTIRGQPPGKASEVENIADCRDYEHMLDEWGNDFRYLEAVESRFPCAGMCYNARRLWYDTGALAPNCSPFILQKIHAAYIQALIVLGCSILLLLLMIPSQSMLVGPMLEHYNDLIEQAAVHSAQASLQDRAVRKS